MKTEHHTQSEISQSVRHPAPIFIGGTGRSGTSVIAHMFKAHPAVYYFPEPRFLIDKGGLNDFLVGSISLARFSHTMLTVFREKVITKINSYKDYGDVSTVFSQKQVQSVIDEAFSENASKIESARRFVDGIFSLGTRSRGSSFVVEKTPHTILMADKLFAMFPCMRYIHIIRNPKDVCCSMLTQAWGPRTVDEFISYWRTIMSQAYGVQRTIPLTHYCVVSVDSCVTRKHSIVPELMQFAGLPYHETTIQRGIEMIQSDRAHCGRWQEGLSPADSARISHACDDIYQMWQVREQESLVYMDSLGETQRI